jgi:dihydroneopterin aldolase
MKYNYILLLIFFFFIGCVNYKTAYFRSSASIITNETLSFSSSEEERKKRAKIVLNVATLIKTLIDSKQMSVEDLAKTLNSYLLNKPEWDSFVSYLILIYADYSAQVQHLPENPKIKALEDALNKIAEGCILAAQKYVD